MEQICKHCGLLQDIHLLTDTKECPGFEPAEPQPETSAYMKRKSMTIEDELKAAYAENAALRVSLEKCVDALLATKFLLSPPEPHGFETLAYRTLLTTEAALSAARKLLGNG